MLMKRSPRAECGRCGMYETAKEIITLLSPHYYAKQASSKHQGAYMRGAIVGKNWISRHAFQHQLTGHIVERTSKHASRYTSSHSKDSHEAFLHKAFCMRRFKGKGGGGGSWGRGLLEDSKIEFLAEGSVADAPVIIG